MLTLFDHFPHGEHWEDLHGDGNEERKSGNAGSDDRPLDKGRGVTRRLVWHERNTQPGDHEEVPLEEHGDVNEDRSSDHPANRTSPVSYTHLRAHETVLDL